MKFLLLLLAFLLAITASAQVTTTHGDLKLIHARATPSNAKVTIRISEPAEQQVVPGTDVIVKFKAQNWTTSPAGKHFHVILDQQVFQDHYTTDPIVLKNVSPGAHVIRLFPVHAWHETVKQQNAIAIVSFYVKEKSGSFPIDKSKPMMIYSAPAGEHSADEKISGQPHEGILVDWFLHNVSMGSKAGYYVQISVDGNVLMSMKEWRPHYVQGLQPGTHRIKLELLKNGTPLTDNGNSTEHTITVR